MGCEHDRSPPIELDEGVPLTTAETPPQTRPEIDDRYRVDELLSRIPGAAVWLGWDTRLQRPVRLRVLSDAEQLSNAMVVARLDHPGLLATVDIAPEPAVVITEHIETRRLSDDAPGSWAWRDAVAVLSPVAAAIASAHDADLVHGALSTDSIEIGPEDRVLVTDLIGLAGAPPAVDVDRLTRLLAHMVTGCAVDVDDTEVVEAMAAMSPAPPPQIVGFVAAGLDDTDRPTDAEQWRSRLSALPQWPGAAPVEEIAFIRSERAWFIPALLVIALAVVTGTVGLVAGRTDVGHRIFDGARDVVGLADGPTTSLVDHPGPGAEPVDVGLSGSPGELADDDVASGNEGRAATAPIAALLDFDPAGNDSGEHPERLRLVNDADPEDGWHTERYNSRDFGSLKEGVGMIVRLESPTPIDQVVISSPDVGWGVAVYASQRGVPADLDSWGSPLGGATGIRGDALVSLGGADVSTLLVWITDLGPADGDGHRVTITRIDPLVAGPDASGAE